MGVQYNVLYRKENIGISLAQTMKSRRFLCNIEIPVLIKG